MVWNQIQFVAIHSNTTPRFTRCSIIPTPIKSSRDKNHRVNYEPLYLIPIKG